MKRKAYKSDPVLSNLEHSQYAYGNRDYIKFESIIDSTRWDLKDFISWISSDNERTKYKFLLKQYGYEQEELKNIPLFTQNMVYYPTNKIRFYVNKENVKSPKTKKIKDIINDHILIFPSFKNG